MGAENGISRKGRLRRWLVRLLNPRPPFWERASVWFGIGVVLLIQTASQMPQTGSGGMPVTTSTAYRIDDDLILWESLPSNPGPQLQNGLIRVVFGYTFDIRFGSEHVGLTFHVLPGSAASAWPVTAAQEQILRRRAAERLVGPTAVVFRFGSPELRASQIVRVMLEADTRVHDRVVLRDYLVGGAAIASLGLIVTMPVLGFLRGAQLTWYDIQRRRMLKDQCPRCAYDVSRITLDRCPECGVHLASARDEVQRVLGPIMAQPGVGRP